MANPPHVPTPELRKQVQAMSGFGIQQDRIGRIIGLDPKTLRKHYRDELDLGTDKSNALVADSLFRKALGSGQGSVTAAIFWLKTRAHWKETTSLELGLDENAAKHSEIVFRVVPPAQG